MRGVPIGVVVPERRSAFLSGVACDVPIPPVDSGLRVDFDLSSAAEAEVAEKDGVVGVPPGGKVRCSEGLLFLLF